MIDKSSSTRIGGDTRSIEASEFRATLRRLQKQNSAKIQRNLVRRWLGRLNQTLGNPRRFYQALREAIAGVRQYGDPIARTHCISRANQFIHVYADTARYGTYYDEFYLYRFYLPERRRNRALHFPFVTQTALVMRALNDALSPIDAEALRNKSAFAKRCHEHSLPTPAILAEFENGVMTVGEPPFPPGDLFSKPAERAAGDGGRRWSMTTVSTDELIGSLREQSKGRFGRILLQRRLTNHPAMAPLTNGSLSTLRIVTAKNPAGEIEFLPTFIRMPTGDSHVDNYAKGGLVAPVDADSGVISGPPLKKDSELGMIMVERHPDNGSLIEGHQVPLWNEALALARRAHRAFPTMVFVGWDIPILADGPILLEGNPIFDTDATLLPHDLALSDTQFIPYCNFHFRNTLLKFSATSDR